MFYLGNIGYRYKLYVQLIIILVCIGRGFGRCFKMLRQYPEGASDTETSEKYRLIFW